MGLIMEKILFNDNWKFWEDKDSFALVWNIPEVASEITLPHDAMLISGKNEHSINGTNTGFRDGGVYTYVKLYTPAKEDEGKMIQLHFEGVYMNALVYVNGQNVISHPYGYTGFTVTLNDYLKYGQENEIRVSVRNSGMSNSRWYSGSGIYRDVYLLKSEQTYLKYQGCFVNTDYIDDTSATLSITETVINRALARHDLTLLTEIIDDKGSIVASKAQLITAFSGDEESYTHRMVVASPKLWSDDTPYLYSLRCALKDGDTVIDTDEHTFGIRTLQVDAKNGLRINGKTTNLRGACIHHDNGILGAATFYESEYRRVKLLKEAGFNAIRMSHHPAAPALLRACDELGMYVMDEAFDMWTRCKSDNDYALWFNDNWKNDVAAMVEKNRLSPSVIMYSIGNEIPEIGTDKGARLAKEMSDFLKTMDNTRFTLASINGVFAAGDSIDRIVADVTAADGATAGNVNNFMAIMDTKMDEIVVHDEISKRLEKACATLDIAGYNYMTARYEKDLKENPDRVIVGSETYPPEIARNWEIIERQSNVIGDFTWTGWDYIGEAGIGVVGYAWGEGGFGAGYPKQLAYVGDIDITGFRRPASYFRELVFGLRKKPYIVVQNPYKYGEHPMMTPWVISDSIASYTYPDMVSKPIVVEVYSAGDEIELLRNGVSVGKEKVSGFIARFDTVYEPGEVTAISYESGKEIARSTLKTVSDAKLKADVSYTNGCMTYIDIVNADSDGNVDTYTKRRIKATVEDALEFRMGSGNYEPDDNFITDETNLFLDRGQLIVRKKHEGDKVKVTITSDADSLELEV